MANCRYCGRPVKGRKLACDECLENYAQYAITTENRNDDQDDDDQLKDTNVWDYFSTIGHVLGYVSLVLAFIPYCSFIAFIFSGNGIVFSLLGRKSNTHTEKTNSGLVMGIAALFISIVMSASCIICSITCFKIPT